MVGEGDEGSHDAQHHRWVQFAVRVIRILVGVSVQVRSIHGHKGIFFLQSIQILYIPFLCQFFKSHIRGDICRPENNLVVIDDKQRSHASAGICPDMDFVVCRFIGN